MLKGELRKEIRERKRQFDSATLAGLSLAAVKGLSGHPAMLRAGTVVLYHPLADEVDVRPLLAIATSKTLLLPRVTGPTDMELRLYTGPDCLAAGAFGIMEPSGPLFTDYHRIDLAIIPGMAFDRHGHRLGRGRGYYDRFLPHIHQAYKIGVCFPFQLVDSVPTEQTDVPVDEVMCGELRIER